MKWFSYSALLLLFVAAVNASFWHDNDDFERAMDPYKNSLSQEYLRALSIFKRKLQLLGFYPLVLNDDGLEYVSMDPYLIEDDDDDGVDEMYKLLKNMKKEKKARKKLQKKKKSKKTKKGTEPPPTVETTTVQPISNIVYFWPSAITTIVHPGQGEGTYQHSIDTRLSIEDSSEENSSEVDASSNDKPKPAKINYQTSFTFGRKLDNVDMENETLPSAATTTTPYPLLTVVPDPEQVAIQEIIDQQEIVNKNSNNDRGNTTKTVLVEGQDRIDGTTDASVTVQGNLTETDAVQVFEGSSSYSQDAKDADKVPVQNLPIESATVTADATSSTSIDVTTELSVYSTEPTPSIPTGALQFFHETLPDEHIASNGLPNLSEIFDNVPVSTATEASISHELEQIAENITNIDGHRETDTQPDHSIVPLSEVTTAMPQVADEHSTTPKSTDGTAYTELEVTVPTNISTNEPEGHEYLIDPKITRPLKVIDILDGFESRSLIDEPVIVAVDDKSGRRSDVPIEADDVNEEDTTDNLAYNLTGDKLEESKIVENTSAEVSTPAPSVEASNHDNYDQFDGEIIPLIPIIIKQMKQGNVSPEEMEILKNSFGPFWPFIVEEASRENDSSEEMNPLLSELLNSVNRKIVKREATFGRRRPVYERRIYFDDNGDDLRRTTYYGRRRRRPYIRYYQKK